MTWYQWLTSKTVLSAIGLIGLGVYQISQGQYETGIQSILAGLAMLGLRHAIAKVANGEK